MSKMKLRFTEESIEALMPILNIIESDPQFAVHVALTRFPYLKEILEVESLDASCLVTSNSFPIQDSVKTSMQKVSLLIANIAVKSKMLKAIYLDSNNLHSFGPKVAEILATSASLEYVNMSNNYLESYFVEVAEAIKSSISIKNFIINGNEIREHVEAGVNHLVQMASLTGIDISYNWSDAHLLEVFEAILKTHNIKTLKFGDGRNSESFQFGETYIEKIFQVAIQSSLTKIIYPSDNSIMNTGFKGKFEGHKIDLENLTKALNHEKHFAEAITDVVVEYIGHSIDCIPN